MSKKPSDTVFLVALTVLLARNTIPYMLHKKNLMKDPDEIIIDFIAIFFAAWICDIKARQQTVASSSKVVPNDSEGA